MASLLDRELVLVTGKGGTGKTTISCALALLGARLGRRTILVELGGQQHAPALLGSDEDQTAGGATSVEKGRQRTTEIQLREDLWSVSVDPDEAMLEWLCAVAGRAATRVLSASSTFRYFAAAAPGARELVTMVKLLDLLERYQTIVLDAPATGHVLAMLRSPQTFSSIARVGPLASRSDQVRALLADPRRSGYLAVTQGSEMAVTETLELEDSLQRLLERDLDAVVVNGVHPRRFTREEMKHLTAFGDGQDATSAAVATARTAYLHRCIQQSHIARLRRQRSADEKLARVLTVPYEFAAQLSLESIEAIATRLGRNL